MSKISPERAKLQNRSWFAVVMAYQTCMRQYGRMLATFKLSVAQFEVLSAIDELQEAATPATIARRLLVTKGNISGLLRRLGDQDLITLLPNPGDGRSLHCRLSPRAAALVAKAQTAAGAFIHAQLAPFSDAQLADTQTQMTRMRLHLEQIDLKQLVALASTQSVASKSKANRQ